MRLLDRRFVLFSSTLTSRSVSLTILQPSWRNTVETKSVRSTSLLRSTACKSGSGILPGKSPAIRLKSITALRACSKSSSRRRSSWMTPSRVTIPLWWRQSKEQMMDSRSWHDQYAQHWRDDFWKPSWDIDAVWAKGNHGFTSTVWAAGLWNTRSLIRVSTCSCATYGFATATYAPNAGSSTPAMPSAPSQPAAPLKVLVKDASGNQQEIPVSPTGHALDARLPESYQNEFHLGMVEIAGKMHRRLPQAFMRYA